MRRPTQAQVKRATAILRRCRNPHLLSINARRAVQERWGRLTPEQRRQDVVALRKGLERHYDELRQAKLAEQSTRDTPPDAAQ